MQDCSNVFRVKKILDSDSGLINSNEELEELMILAKKVQTHDCEGSDYRCHKKCNDFGKAVCRFRVYQPGEETFSNRYHVLIQKRWSYYAKLYWLSRN